MSDDVAKVYIVIETEGEYSVVRGVFSKKQRAINYLRECQYNYSQATYSVQEWELDGARID